MPVAVDGAQVTVAFPPSADFLRRKADDDGYRQCVADGRAHGHRRKAQIAYVLAEAPPDATTEPAVDAPPTEDEWVRRFVAEFDAEEIRPRPPRERGQLMPQPNMNQMMKQVQKMQKDMMAAQEQLANETVTASAGGGMVTVTVTGDLVVKDITIDPDAIDPEDPELLQDMVLAAVNEAHPPGPGARRDEDGRPDRRPRPRRPRASGM